LPGESVHSTSINNSPASNFSILRDDTSFALNPKVTLRLLFIGISSARLDPDSHLGQSGPAALYRRNLVLTADRPHHGLYVRYRTGSPFIDRHQQWPFARRIGSVSPVHGAGHLVDLIQALTARLCLIFPPDLIGGLQGPQNTAQKDLCAVVEHKQSFFLY
jgi:hypothetical protein